MSKADRLRELQERINTLEFQLQEAKEKILMLQARANWTLKDFKKKAFE